MILFDWRCTICDHTFEKLVKSSTMETPCEKCAGTAKRALLKAPRIDHLAMGASKHAGPESIDYFERVHKQQKTIEERNEANHGDYGPSPGAD